ncbi:Scr1 family TA system antitoxin-like transcriptional regulator, partial [Nocardia brasiliensis]|uniref:Scr1 family TA system antitoxin-like transcriptional regulator n=1 Tax=Nocardia brasiliensis TaxID=37326 RepID=UPI002454D5CE
PPRGGGWLVPRAPPDHLFVLSPKPWVTILVLPSRPGATAAAGSSFTMLRFAERELPDIVYLEQLTTALYLDRPEEVRLYREVMDRLAVQAETPQRSRDLMIAAAAEL